MALSTQEQWESFFKEAGIEASSSSTYATTFVTNKITHPEELTRDILKELGIRVVGDAMAIIRHAKTMETNKKVEKKETAEHQFKPQISPPKIQAEMTSASFRKFRVDWQVYKQITKIPADQISPLLYSACDPGVQNSILNTEPEFLKLDEEKNLAIIEKLVTKLTNPTVHRLSFANLNQSTGESINSYIVRLKETAKDCSFSCPNCSFDMTNDHVKDQLIRGIANPSLQTDILAKASTLKSLEDITKHAEAYEAALRDQTKISDNSTQEVMKFGQTNQRQKERTVTKHKEYRGPQTASTKPRNTYTETEKCRGCGSHPHGPNNINRSRECPAFDKKCGNCGKFGHFSKVCFRKPSRTEHFTSEDDTLLAHVEEDKENGNFSTVYKINPIQEIPAIITTYPNNSKKTNTTETLIFPDSGAGICLAGPKHAKDLGLKPSDLTPSTKRVVAVGGTTMTCKGSIKVNFKIDNNSTDQTLFICDKVDRIYLSRDGCHQLNILPSSFPYPMTKDELNAIKEEAKPKEKDPNRKLPYPPTEENIEKLKEYLINSFPTVFEKSTPFQEMKCKPVHIHLKENAKPYATHVPIPVPLHWKQEVKANLDQDVKLGIIEKVPTGEPVVWCSPMVVTRKHDGRPRRTVDLQKLNSQCLRETHHCESPFKLASQVPANMRKTVLDATDGYHSIPLDDESKPLTTFITEWGRYRYKRLPQGFMAAGDAYTARYDEIIKDIKRKVKCIDDSLLYDPNIENNFFSTYDYLVLCRDNGITLNKPKFQFCQLSVEFAGLRITDSGIKPSDKIISAIKNFKKPTTIKQARAWFGLVAQISWTYSTSEFMQPLRNLVKKNSKFLWDATLDKIFEDSKQKLVDCSIEGIQTYDLTKPTCLQTDWSREGIGYLLLQQNCSCKVASAPVCCKEGWKIVFAGSRFTKGAETRYSATEGELLAVAWALEHAKFFILGNSQLEITTDHKPLTGLLKNTDLCSIRNNRIFNLIQRTRLYNFNIHYNPGKYQRGPDALSRNPDPSPTMSIFEDSQQESEVQDIRVESIMEYKSIIDIPEIEEAARKDPSYRSLLNMTKNKIPKERHLMEPDTRPFWYVRDKLAPYNNLVLMDERIVIPKSLRSRVLKHLHSAHQGASSMIARAQQSIYWPGMTADIRNERFTCQACNERSPSQPKESYSPSPPPQYPFQEISLDYFSEGHHHYLSVVDRFTAWLIIYHFPTQATSEKLISKCREIFTSYGAPEILDSDGGPQFSAHEFQKFLSDWGIKHRLSSVDYPQSNGRAELAVKSAKRIILQNTNPDGSLNNDQAARAILQQRNTPLRDIGLSPAQLLLHRQLKDSIPTNPKLLRPHKDWIISAENREKAFAHRNMNIENAYNANAHDLKPLQIHTPVRIQDKGKWFKSGIIIETLSNRQYRIRLDGSGRITLRNRRFIKPIEKPENKILISPQHTPKQPDTHELQNNESNVLPKTPQFTETNPQDIDPNGLPIIPPPMPDPPTLQSPTQITHQTRSRIPRLLKTLADYNSQGNREVTRRPNSRLRSGNEF